MRSCRQGENPKIVYIITMPDLGGAQNHVYEVMTNIREYGFTPLLVTGQAGWLTDTARKVGIKTYIVPSIIREISPLQDLRAILEVKKILQIERPGLVHCHSSKAGIIGRFAAKLCHVPAIFTVHGWAFTEGVSFKKRLLYSWIENMAGYMSKKIICVSEYDRQLGIRILPAHKDKFVTIHNCISDMPNFVRNWEENPIGRTLRCVVVARFSPQKRNKEILRILRKILDDGGDMTVTFIGDGPGLSYARDEAKRLHLEERAIFLGACANVGELLPEYDVFLLLSNWEGFPISILEAMRAGLPVIASDVGGVKEAVNSGENGWLVHTDDDCVRLMGALRQNHYLLIEAGKNGRRAFLDFFTTDKMMEQSLDVYGGITKSIL